LENKEASILSKIADKFTGAIKLIRVKQWYKNLVVFLPLIFTFNLFNWHFFLLTAAGFLSLCLASSAGYIINDIKDVKKDRVHPEKKHRPIASGKIKMFEGYFLALFFAAVSGLIAYKIRISFMLFVAGLFILTQVYTFWLKTEAFADIITIASLFVIRAVSGVVIIDVPLGPWIIITMFFLAAFLATGKRQSDLQLMKEKAAATRKTLEVYTLKILDAMLIISATCIIITYALFVSLSNYKGLFITLPFLAYSVLYYYSKIQSSSKMARHPELFARDKKLMTAIGLQVLLTVLVLYF